MKSKLLAAAAVISLVASGVVAKAQETPNHEQRPGAERSEPNAQRMAPQHAPVAEPQQREQPARNEASAPNQGPRTGEAQSEPRNGEQHPRAAQTEPNRGQEPRRNEEKRTSQEQQPNRTAEPNGQRDNRMAEPNGQREKSPAARTGENDNQRPAVRTGESDNQRNAPRTAEHQDGRGQPRVIGNVKSSQEHATRVGEVLQREGHREHVDFGVNVGARVPDNFEIYPLPAEVLGFAPEYRGYDYFVDDNDEIVFVSPDSHEIVGAIDYEGRAASEAPMTNVAGARPCPIEQ